MSELSISPMLVQYLVGLCCQKSSPDAVDVIIGDMVDDKAAEKKRDIDVTVTIKDNEQITHAFMAYEVKHENKPVDITTVEQLCIKLMDMPSITHKAIVSTSGFTRGAVLKAGFHKVTLYHIRDWDKPLEEQFPLLTMKGKPQECFPFSQALLCWKEQKFYTICKAAKGPFMILPEQLILKGDGVVHQEYKSAHAFFTDLLFKSTDLLFSGDLAQTMLKTFPVPFNCSEGYTPSGPPWPHSHTIDTDQFDAYVVLDKEPVQINAVTIGGFLQWERGAQPRYYVMEDISTGQAFGSTLIALGPKEGQMTALIFEPKVRDISLYFVNLGKKHLNAIRSLSLRSGEVSSAAKQIT